MKKTNFWGRALWALWATCFCISTLQAQGIAPEFSTDGKDVWYQVQFKTGSGYLTDNGAGLSSVQISDLSGKPLFAGTRNRVELTPAWGKLILVTVTATGGKTETHKIVLN